MKSSMEEDLKKLPEKPGVYLMHDEKDKVIYVGKAINLKNRVRQYFQTSRNVTAKIERMISQIEYFEYIVTDSELEALILECNLIKEHNPKYNTMLKDGKSYPFLKATVQEAYPRLVMDRILKQDGAKYFGPFVSAKAIHDTIEVLNKVFRLRSCKRKISKGSYNDRPCLYYEMKICEAPCQGLVSEEAYLKRFEKVLDFLSGNTASVFKKIENKMKEASKNYEFEEAAIYRDGLESLKIVTQKQKITTNHMEEHDIIAIEKAEDEAVAQVFFVRGGKLIGREHYYLTGVSEETDGHILAEFIKQMYAGTPYIPREVFLEEKIEEEDKILEWLSTKRGQKVNFHIPKKGAKERLMTLAKRNARLLLEQDAEKFKREELRTTGAMSEIGKLIGCNIKRIESYDISTINGFQTVGSMVVYENGKPKKNDYRKFRIEKVIGPDDYGAMEEMLGRRFERNRRQGLRKVVDSFSIIPDLILMDGGKGQVNVCENILDKLGFNIPVCGMVKNDKHQTRGLYYKNEEIPLDTKSQGFYLITRIQDETHRFAIEYHRSLRSKEQVRSILDDIDKVGPKRRKELMKHFGSLEAIKNASIDELKCVPLINEPTARSIFNFFIGK